MKPFTAFENAFDQAYYSDIPDDWYIAVADVKNSTTAIEKGRYKDVNMVGASCIIAVLNTVKDHTDIPYVFGGDGASFAIPSCLAEQIAAALLGTQKMALETFQLDLRVCLIPVSDIIASGRSVKLGKYELSEHVHIAMLSGGGVAYADLLAKKNQAAYEVHQYITEETVIEADLTGLECRWQPVKSEHGKILSLLIAATDEKLDQGEGMKIYQSLLPDINKILNKENGSHPLSSSRMKLTKNIKELRQELETRTYKQHVLKKTKYAAAMFVKILIGSFLFAFDTTLGAIRGKAYIDDVIRQSDFQKFDDMIRMVVDCSDTQIQELQTMLEQHHKSGHIFYGMHCADSALVTCMIFSRLNEHVHFVDGAAGGYALAARNLKSQMQRKTTSQAA